MAAIPRNFPLFYHLPLLLLLLLLLVGVYADEGYPRGNYPGGRQVNYEESQRGDWPDEGIPGVAGRDYPTFHEVPPTRFQCERQRQPGYYADIETSCQAFHICQAGGRKDSFLCPNGTLFNQEKLVCEWWNVVDCSRAESFYTVNEAIVRAMRQSTRRASEDRSNGYEYGLPKFANGRNEAIGLTHADRQNRENSANSPSAPRPVYGLETDLSAPTPPGGRYDDDYGSAGQKYRITEVSFSGKRQNSLREPSDTYLPA